MDKTVAVESSENGLCCTSPFLANSQLHVHPYFNSKCVRYIYSLFRASKPPTRSICLWMSFGEKFDSFVSYAFQRASQKYIVTALFFTLLFDKKNPRSRDAWWIDREHLQLYSSFARSVFFRWFENAKKKQSLISKFGINFNCKCIFHG